MERETHFNGWTPLARLIYRKAIEGDDFAERAFEREMTPLLENWTDELAARR